MCAKKVHKEKDTRPGSSFLRAPAHKGPYMWVRICDHSITRAHEALHAFWRQAPSRPEHPSTCPCQQQRRSALLTMVARTEEQRRRRASGAATQRSAALLKERLPGMPPTCCCARPCALSACGKAESYAEPREKESPTSPEEEVDALAAGYAPCHRLLLLIPST